jgi:two-component system sensor histidine kinase HydH
MELRLTSILCLPLLVRGKGIGVVYMDGRQKKLEPLDRGSFETIAGLCAVAIERARLADEGRRNRILATVGTAASSIAIEFCNALEAMSGHIETLSEHCRDDAAQERLSQIRASLGGLTSMSSKLLMFADIGPLETTQTDMFRFLHGKLREWRERTKGSGIEITGFGPECAARIETQNFSGVVDNLFANSVAALAGRGPGAKIELSWETASGALRIKVADNGKGIPPDVLENIFEPRFSPDRKGSGGIGLASVKMHIEEHGGTVGVESEAGKGATVTIDLPAQVRAGADTTSSWAGPPPGPG